MAGVTLVPIIVKNEDGTIAQKNDQLTAEHVERILRMPNNGGWELPVDSAYTFSQKDGLKPKK